MRGASAKRLFGAAALFAALASSCAAISGLDDFGIVDCPAGSTECVEGGALADVVPPPQQETSLAADAGKDTQVGPPACDPQSDPACLPLPVGWTLVAFAAFATGSDAGAPACPTGLDSASDVGEGPAARPDTCECASCTVTAPNACTGAITHEFSPPAGMCETAGAPHANNPPGTCLTDLYTGARDGNKEKLTLPAPTGGACAASAPVAHDDRVTFASRSRVCDDTARCSGGTCDARVPAPFVACIASPKQAADEDRDCPAAFPQKHLVGTGAAFTCPSTCTCGVNRSCSGSVTFYANADCSGGAKLVPADGTCRQPNFVGAYLSYRATTTPATTCTASGSSTATNARVTAARTICCR
jgi:hypothetical protein